MWFLPCFSRAIQLLLKVDAPAAVHPGITAEKDRWKGGAKGDDLNGMEKRRVLG
jgi:hypothetical protein